MHNKRIFFLELSILIFIVILKFVFLNWLTLYANIFNLIFWLIIGFVTTRLLGHYNDRHVCRATIIKSSIITVVISLIITFFCGLITGFDVNIVSLSIIPKVLSLLVMIVSQELIRYIIAKKSSNDYISLIVLTILYIVLDIVLISELTLVKLSVSILPIITRHLLFSYLAYNISYIPNIIFKLFFYIIPVITPIIPSTNQYLKMAFLSIIPILFYIYSRMTLKNSVNERYIPINKKPYLVYIPVLVFFAFIIILITGFFRYQIMAIGSSSMNPTISIGDAIIFEKNDKFENLNKNDIIVYRHNGKYVTHRIDSVNKEEHVYQTKGDNNPKVDDYTVTPEDIVGVYRFKIPFLGYPTLWFHNLLK